MKRTKLLSILLASAVALSAMTASALAEVTVTFREAACTLIPAE